MYNPRLVRSIVFERTLPGTNEVFGPDGAPRPIYETVLGELEKIGPRRWKENLHQAHGLLSDEQHAFGIREDDKTHPTDWFPRVVPASDWERLERGLVQRMRAINVVAVESARPGQSGGWEFLVLEENAKMPVGLAAMTRRRKMSAEVFFPGALAELPVRPLDGWLGRLGSSLRAASPKGPEATLAVVSSGPDDQFYLDHHIYAKEMGAILAETKHLSFDRSGYLVHEPTEERIDVIYERVDEDKLYADLPELIDCHVEGRVHVLFAPNSEVVDDKGVEVFVPEMIRRYLGEEPFIRNARTWSLAVPEDRRYVMEHFGELVIKSRGGYGGKEVLIGPEEPKESIARFRQIVERNPIEYIAQEFVNFSTHVLCETREKGFTLRDSHADYRMLALAPDPRDPSVVEVVPGALTRVATPGSHLTNISSGGKMKDTWILER